MSLRFKPIYRVLYRPNLLMGCERKPMLTILITGMSIAVCGANLVAISAGVIIIMGGTYLLRWTAKADQSMVEIYKRTLRYERYYPARSRPFRRT